LRVRPPAADGRDQRLREAIYALTLRRTRLRANRACLHLPGVLPPGRDGARHSLHKPSACLSSVARQRQESLLGRATVSLDRCRGRVPGVRSRQRLGAPALVLLHHAGDVPPDKHCGRGPDHGEKTLLRPSHSLTARRTISNTMPRDTAVSKPGPDELKSDAADRLQAELQQLRNSRKRLVVAADADRRAIERALHDGLLQFLVAIAVNLRRLAGLIDEDRSAAKALIDEIALQTTEALDGARELGQAIYPPLLEASGLASALRSAAASAGVRASVTAPAEAGYPPEVAVAVYWCCLEALSSAPAGTEATVTVAEADGGLTFEVTVVDPYSDERLQRVRDRAEALGGRLTSGEDNPTRVAGWLPRSA
jgi:signal transduction histidine kinase